MTPLFYRRDAATDVAAAHAWYEAQRPGLGHEFLEVLREAEETVRSSPLTFRVLHRGTRRYLLRRFPYQLLYRVTADAVVVVACFHVRRSLRRASERRDDPRSAERVALLQSRELLVESVLREAARLGFDRARTTTGWSLKLGNRSIFHVQLTPPKNRGVVTQLRWMRRWADDEFLGQLRECLEPLLSTHETDFPSIAWSRLEDASAFTAFTQVLEWAASRCPTPPRNRHR